MGGLSIEDKPNLLVVLVSVSLVGVFVALVVVLAKALVIHAAGAVDGRVVVFVVVVVDMILVEAEEVDDVLFVLFVLVLLI